MNSSFEYQESLNSLHFTEEEKAAIARRAGSASAPPPRPGGQAEAEVQTHGTAAAGGEERQCDAHDGQKRQAHADIRDGL